MDTVKSTLMHTIYPKYSCRSQLVRIYTHGVHIVLPYWDTVAPVPCSAMPISLTTLTRSQLVFAMLFVGVIHPGNISGWGLQCGTSGNLVCPCGWLTRPRIPPPPIPHDIVNRIV